MRVTIASPILYGGEILSRWDHGIKKSGCTRLASPIRFRSFSHFGLRQIAMIGRAVMPTFFCGF